MSKVGPSRVWYWVALAIVVGSLIPTYFMARSALDTLDFSIEAIDDGIVEVHDERLSVFWPGELADQLVQCSVTPEGSSREIPLDVSTNELTIDGNQRVGLLPDDLPEGTYRLRCESGGTPVDVEGFGVQSTEGWTDAILLLIAAILLPIVAGLIGITIAVITAVRRSSARRQRLRPPPPYGSAGFPSAPTPKA
jgi:hypothetical protein